MASLQEVAAAVVRRAQRQGYVVPSDIREELIQAGLPDSRWKEVIKLAGDALAFRQKRYYPISRTVVSPRLQQTQMQHQLIKQVMDRFIQSHLEAKKRQERRQDNRIDYMQPVQVVTEDGRKFTLLSRDLSSTGIRLVGTRGLLGQKVLVTFAAEENQPPCTLRVRILWTCAIGDDLFENGGTFLEVISPTP